MSDSKRYLLEGIDSRKATVAVIGLGYVGLPLALGLRRSGFPVFGVDIDEAKVRDLQRGRSDIPDVPGEELTAAFSAPLVFTDDYSVIRERDVVLICVPTPLNKTRDPDMSHLIACCEALSDYVDRGMLVVLESTTYPGTTVELVKPILEQNGRRAGSDFFLAFSPERIDPGRRDFNLFNTPKVVGALTPECLQVATRLYATIVERVVPVSSTQAAEMVKLLENTFRVVNIALVNEIAIMCDKLDLDVSEVIEAAATKPYGFMKFTPGPGVGGHCISLDPHYLSWKLKTLNYNARFIQLAGEVNSEMPHFWVNKVQDALNQAGKCLKQSRILILGVTYKKDVNDVRESPALDVIELLRSKGADVAYFDPHVPQISQDGYALDTERDLDAALSASDCVLIVADHSCFDWTHIAKRARLLIDTRNVLKEERWARPA